MSKVHGYDGMHVDWLKYFIFMCIDNLDEGMLISLVVEPVGDQATMCERGHLREEAEIMPCLTTQVFHISIVH